jgi:hypothetical protein
MILCHATKYFLRSLPLLSYWTYQHCLEPEFLFSKHAVSTSSYRDPYKFSPYLLIVQDVSKNALQLLLCGECLYFVNIYT